MTMFKRLSLDFFCSLLAPLAGWVMFDAAVRHNGGLSHANFFRFEHLMLVLVHGYSFEIVAWSRNAEQSRNQSRSFRKEIRSSYPSLHGALRTIRQTNGQAERQLKAHGTYSRLRLLSVISSGTRKCISRCLENMWRKAGAYLCYTHTH